VLQCVAVCTRIRAVCCSVLQCVAVYCSVLQCIAVYCSVLQCVVVFVSRALVTISSNYRCVDAWQHMICRMPW